jgi:hypothetical protein
MRNASLDQNVNETLPPLEATRSDKRVLIRTGRGQDPSKRRGYTEVLSQHHQQALTHKPPESPREMMGGLVAGPVPNRLNNIPGQNIHENNEESLEQVGKGE